MKLNSKIFIVEDEAITAKAIESQIRKMGYDNTTIAINYKNAMKSIREDRPDLILLDIDLKSDYSGIDIANHDKLELLLDATKERGKTLVELANQINLILNAPTEYNPKASKKAFKGTAKEYLEEFIGMLKNWDKPLHTPPEYHAVIEKFVADKEIGFGKIGQPLRVSLLGAMTGSGLDEIMAILGVDETINRVQKAIEFIESRD